MSDPRRVQKATTVRPAQRPGLSAGRLTVVIVLAAALLLTLAPPLREFLSQRAQIAKLEVRSADQADRVQQLQKQAEQWQSDDYVRQQARQRLHYQLPGETGFIVVDPPQDSVAEELVVPVAEDDRAWYERAWSSLERAQQPPDSTVVVVRPDAPR